MNPQHHTACFALLEVAAREGLPLSSILQSINEAILDAHSSALAEPNPNALAVWSDIPCAGDISTAVELVAYLAQQVQT